jgi:hypothetical protein
VLGGFHQEDDVLPELSLSDMRKCGIPSNEVAAKDLLRFYSRRRTCGSTRMRFGIKCTMLQYQDPVSAQAARTSEWRSKAAAHSTVPDRC